MPTIAIPAGVNLSAEVNGSGPVIVFVSGALDDGAELRPVADALAGEFTTVVYSRRGRGDSEDAAGTSVDDEIADLDAVIAATSDGPVDVFGSSSGGVLALRAAAAGSEIKRLAVWEVPFDLSTGAAERHEDYRRRIREAIDADSPGEALELAMATWGSPPEVIEQARTSPFWPTLLRIAPTLRYDADVMGDNTPPHQLLAGVACPVLVATGAGVGEEMAGLDGGYFDGAADRTVELLPSAERTKVATRGHELDADAAAPVLRRFFSEE